MPGINTCSNGHSWAAATPDEPCPECGSTAEGAGLATRRTPGIPSLAATQLRTDVRPVDASLPTVPGYEIIDELGRGGMGVVYRARHLALNRLVALKLIRSGVLAGVEELARFHAEAEAIARLQHPNVIQVFDVGEHEGMPFLALEFADGGNLSSHLRVAECSPREVAALVSTLARAVQHAHSRGVVHRDLKPANVLMTAQATLKIADFGLAKLLDNPARSQTGRVMGTPLYMAPEQASGAGDLVGPLADVWALGAILYEGLGGRPPFLGQTSREIIQQVLTAEPKPLARDAPRTPRDLETICLKCLQKQQDLRYPSAGDLADDLDRFLEGRPIRARRTPTWERAVKWSRRRPAAAALLLGLIFSSVAFGWLGYRHFRDLEAYNVGLEARNETITRNNTELESRNATISRQAHDLIASNIATTQERDRAERNLFAAMDVIDKVLADGGFRQLANAPRTDPARIAMLEESLRFCDRLTESQKDDSRLRLFLAFTFQRSGTLLMQLSRYSEAEERFDRASKLLAAIGPDDPARVEKGSVRSVKALLHLERGRLHLRTAGNKQAREEFETARTLLEDDAAPPDEERIYLQAVAHANLAIAALQESDYEKGKLHLGRSLQRAESLTRKARPAAEAVAIHAYALNALGVACLETDDIDEAQDLFERCSGFERKLVTSSPSHAGYRQALARSLGNLGTVLRKKGYLRRAEEPLAEALAIRESLVREHPDAKEYIVELCWSYFQTGQLHVTRSEARTATDWFTKAIEQLTRDSELYKRDAEARNLLGKLYRVRAAARAELSLHRAAFEDLDAAAAFVSVDLIPALGVDKGSVLVSSGEVVKGVAEVQKALAASGVSAECRFNGARVYARAAKATPEAQAANELARKAIAELLSAEKSGYFRSVERGAMLEKHADFTALRTFEQFKALVARTAPP